MTDQAEQSVLGAILIDNSVYDGVNLLADDFGDETHREIFAAMSAMIEAGRPVDVVTLSDKIGHAGLLGQLMLNTPGTANVKHYAGIIRRKAVDRRLMIASHAIRSLCTSDMEPAEKLAAAESALNQVSGATPEGGSVTIRTAITRVVEAMDDRLHGKTSGLKTGFERLDNALVGLQSGDLIVVAGRPSMGKSAFVDQIAEHVALEGKAVLTFSMEMTAEQIATRRLASVGRIGLQKFRRGDNLETDEWTRLTAAIGKMHEAKLHIDDTPAMLMHEIRARSLRMQREHGLDLVTVDYLQLMSGGGNTRNEEIATISRGLKALAKELGVPVVAVSQLSRKCEERSDKRPIMSDLRESGQIEQDADVIMFVYRDEVYDPDSQYAGTAEIIIGKQRMGPRKTVMLTFIGDYVRFENYAGQPIAPPPKKPRGFLYGVSK